MALDAAGPRGGRPPNFDAIYIKHGGNAAALPAAEAEFAAAMDAHRDAKRHRIAEEMEIKPRLRSPGNRQPNQNRNRIWSKLPRQRLKPSHRRRPMRVVELGGEQVAVYEPAPATPGLVKVTK